jgi:hypothetical protein
MEILIKTSHGILRAAITKDKNPKTATFVEKSLPIRGKTNRWGDEIYFEVPLELEEENPQQDVEIGDIAYWPSGKAICIFFGKTPISTSNKPRAYSPVNVFGKIKSKNLKILKKVKDGEEIIIQKSKH